MRSFVFGLSLSVAFIGGALFSQLAGDDARAAVRVRWEYYCVEKLRESPQELMESFNGGGAKGWELAAAGEYVPIVMPMVSEGPVRPIVWCFKRPLG